MLVNVKGKTKGRQQITITWQKRYHVSYRINKQRHQMQCMENTCAHTQSIRCLPTGNLLKIPPMVVGDSFSNIDINACTATQRNVPAVPDWPINIAGIKIFPALKHRHITLMNARQTIIIIIITSNHIVAEIAHCS